MTRAAALLLLLAVSGCGLPPVALAALAGAAAGYAASLNNLGAAIVAHEDKAPGTAP